MSMDVSSVGHPNHREMNASGLDPMLPAAVKTNNPNLKKSKFF